MSTAFDTIRSAIAGKVRTAVQQAIIHGASSRRGTTAEARAPKVLIKILLAGVPHDPSEPQGSTEQSEHWEWHIQLVVPGRDEELAQTVAYEALFAIRAALRPTAGWRPETYCGDVTVVELGEYLGQAPNVGFVYEAVYVHDRWEG